MSNHSKQFQLYADAVKNELEMAYQQGRADAIDELLKLSKAHSIYGYSIALADLENIADRVKEQNET